MRSGSALRFNSRRAYNRLDAFVQMTSTCKFHFRSSEMVTPNNLTCLTMSTGWLLITIDGKEGGQAEKFTRNSFVFEAFNFMLFADAQCSHWLTVDGMWDWESLERISHVVESSTYLTRSKDGLRSFTIIKNSKRPSFVPCGSFTLQASSLKFWCNHYAWILISSFILFIIALHKASYFNILKKGSAGNVNKFFIVPNRNIKNVGVPPIWIVYSNVSSIGPSSERNRKLIKNLVNLYKRNNHVKESQPIKWEKQ